MGNVLKCLKLPFIGELQVQAARVIGKNKFTPVVSANEIKAITTLEKDNKYTKSKLQPIFNTIGTGILLSKTAGFFPAMGIATTTGGFLGYYLSNSLNNNDKDKNMGLTVEKENQQQNTTLNNEKNIAYIYKNKEKNYHEINTSGCSWEGIVTTFYPGLVDKCNGKLYGKDGAIRILKNQLQKNSDIDLINSSDIPKKLNLPLSLNGIDIKTDAKVPKTKITEGGNTNIEVAGAKDSIDVYTAIDSLHEKSFKSANEQNAIDSLKVMTKVEEYNEVKRAY